MGSFERLTYPRYRKKSVPNFKKIGLKWRPQSADTFIYL